MSRRGAPLIAYAGRRARAQKIIISKLSAAAALMPGGRPCAARRSRWATIRSSAALPIAACRDDAPCAYASGHTEMLLALDTRDRPGKRLMPWTAGDSRADRPPLPRAADDIHELA